MVAASACNDRNAAVYTFYGILNAVHMFLVGHGSGFTGCAADNDSIGAIFDLIIDDLTQSVKVDGFLRIHRGHDGNARAGKDGLFHKLAPF